MKNARTLVMPLLISMLAACGGGGGESSSDPSVSLDQPSNGSWAHLEMINADYAANRSITGAGVTVAVFSTGINIDHREFAGTYLNGDSRAYISKFLANVDQQSPSDPGEDFEKIDQGEPTDKHGGGTHVASLLAGVNAGVAPDIDLLVIESFYEDGGYNDYSLTLGMIDEMGKLGVDFMSVSAHGFTRYETDDTVFGSYKPLFIPLRDDDVGLITSAGNFAVDLTEVYVTNPIDCSTLPPEEQDNYHCYEADPYMTLLAKDPDLRTHVIYVGAIDHDYQLGAFPIPEAETLMGGSNYPGADTDIQERFIVAPGVDVKGADFQDIDGYTLDSSTYQAVPLVAGAAALVKSQYPTLTNAEVLQRLLDTADRSFPGYDKTRHGMGLLDIEAALSAPQ